MLIFTNVPVITAGLEAVALSLIVWISISVQEKESVYHQIYAGVTLAILEQTVARSLTVLDLTTAADMEFV